MKQKIVLKIQLPCSNFTKKVFKVVGEANGVESTGIEGLQRNIVVVTGEGIDIVKLAAKLRKKVGCTDIVNVSQINCN